MIGTSSPSPSNGSSESRYDQAFLSTLRAVAPCAREFARLSASVADNIAESLGGTDHEKIVVRQAPDRCIIQVGEAAVTMTWLRNAHESVAEGELLVILWQGTVAPVRRFQPERQADAATLTAKAVSETVFVADATCEADWTWRPLDSTAQQGSSDLLARTIADRVRLIHESLTPAPSLEQAV
jgi:hypothetical protein